MEFSEHIKTANVEDVVLRVGFRAPRSGALCVTGHHLLFSDREEDSTWQLLLLIRNIDAIEKSVENLLGYPQGSKASQKQRTSGSSGSIVIKCKDLRVLQLDIPGMEECLNIASSIEVHVVYCVLCLTPTDFHSPGLQRVRPPLQDLLHLLPTLTTNHNIIRKHHSPWRLLTNPNLHFSSTSPFPAVFVDVFLLSISSFRQQYTVPYMFLKYIFKSNSSNWLIGFQVIMRSSQPLTGANKKRCCEDELLLQMAIDQSELGYIVDTRSSQHAQHARLSGGGFESKSCYRPWRRLHRHMERGKVLQESLIKLVEACGDSSHNMDRWLSKLENSKWLSHVHSALSTAGLVAECVERDGHSVLVHGSEGTDTTLLVTSLAQIILDPDCRTFRGFLRLLEREWVQAGHPFQQRCARSAYSHARLKYECPSFLLLMDCVWQISRQFPLALEFSEALLLRLGQEAYASDYGTFLCNSEQERHTFHVKENTHCLLWFLMQCSEREHYINPLYEHTQLAIWPSVQPQSLQLWTGLFLRWTEHTQVMDEAREEIRTLVNELKR
ncbi:hypothetical protein C0J50_24025, partial [Silurus asotus]